MKTARQIADEAREANPGSLSKPENAETTAYVENVPDADAEVIRRIARGEGYKGADLDRVAEHAEQLLVGQAQAMSDDLPATGGD